jgi:hypothetical protein
MHSMGVTPVLSSEMQPESIDRAKGEHMKAIKLVGGTVALAVTSTALAQVVPLGTGLGSPLGLTLGNLLGTPLPIVGGGLLVVAAASLGIGIWMVRHKKNR